MCQPFVQVLYGDADPGLDDFAVLDQIGDNFFGFADWNGKPDSLGFGIDGGIYANQLTVDI